MIYPEPIQYAMSNLSVFSHEIEPLIVSFPTYLERLKMNFDRIDGRKTLRLVEDVDEYEMRKMVAGSYGLRIPKPWKWKSDAERIKTKMRYFAIGSGALMAQVDFYGCKYPIKDSSQIIEQLTCEMIFESKMFRKYGNKAHFRTRVKTNG